MGSSRSSAGGSGGIFRKVFALLFRRERGDEFFEARIAAERVLEGEARLDRASGNCQTSRGRGERNISTLNTSNITRTAAFLLPNKFAGFVCDYVRVVDSIAPRAFLANIEFHFCRKKYGRRRKQILRKRSGKILRRRSMHRLRFVPRNGSRQFQTQRRRRSYLRLQTTRDP